MAVATMVSGGAGPTAPAGPRSLTVNSGEKSIGDKPAARINNSPSMGVGIVAARLIDVGPETER
jgi:protein SMG6